MTLILEKIAKYYNNNIFIIIHCQMHYSHEYYIIDFDKNIYRMYMTM